MMNDNPLIDLPRLEHVKALESNWEETSQLPYREVLEQILNAEYIIDDIDLQKTEREVSIDINLLKTGESTPSSETIESYQYWMRGAVKNQRAKKALIFMLKTALLRSGIPIQKIQDDLKFIAS
jgi:hypothetical protein